MPFRSEYWVAFLSACAGWPTQPPVNRAATVIRNLTSSKVSDVASNGLLPNILLACHSLLVSRGRDAQSIACHVRGK